MRKILPWLATVLILVVGFGTIYVAVQQAQRSDANWPQIQLAEDGARAVDQDIHSFGVVGPQVDIAKSLAPFTNLYDKAGKPVAGTGFLNGKMPRIDPGVLSSAKGKDYNAVTWQPAKGVRVAAVAVAGKDYYVVSGRNMKQVEKNENTTLLLSAIGLVASLVILAIWGAVSHLNRLRTTTV